MSKIDEFKSFVKKHPKLINYVKEGKTSWQKFYELYDLYGEKEDIWEYYLTPSIITGGTIAVSDIFNVIKNINLDEFQNGINNVQKVLGMLGDLTKKDTKEYKPRPIYKHFED